METSFKSKADISILKQRAKLVSQVRRFFDDRGFFEVETPILSHDIVVDRYLEPIAVSGSDLGVKSETDNQLWLQTSPEFGMKRLLSSGAESIYQISKCFRAGERGQLHNPEFTMLEWYRVGDDMHNGMALLAEFLENVLETNKCETRSYADVFQSHAGCNVLTDDAQLLADTANAHGLDTSAFENCVDIDAWRNLILTHVVEPQLGRDRPTIVFDWPASQSALAIVRNETPPVAERFEAYYKGLELANGYHELVDAVELRHRNRAVNRQREMDGRSQLPTESRLLAAMSAGLPACSGVAVGLDRLVMLATDSTSIDEVIPFPIEVS